MNQKYYEESIEAIFTWITSNYRYVSKHHPLLMQWWCEQINKECEKMTDEMLDAWEAELEQWAREHPEEDARLCSPESQKRTWDGLRKRVLEDLQVDIGEYKG